MEKKTFTTQANELGPIRVGSVVQIDIPEDASKKVRETFDDVDGSWGTVLEVGNGKAKLLVSDDYGLLEELVPLAYLIHETEPLDQAKRARLIYDMTKVNEHGMETEIIPHEDGILEEEYLTCPYCKGFIELQRVKPVEGEEPVYITARVSEEAGKRCRNNPNIRGKVHLPKIPGFTE